MFFSAFCATVLFTGFMMTACQLARARAKKQAIVYCHLRNKKGASFAKQPDAMPSTCTSVAEHLGSLRKHPWRARRCRTHAPGSPCNQALGHGGPKSSQMRCQVHGSTLRCNHTTTSLTLLQRLPESRLCPLFHINNYIISESRLIPFRDIGLAPGGGHEQTRYLCPHK